MDSLLNKLDNLAYELFGVLLPGLVASAFSALWLFALGPLVPAWTFGYVREVDVTLGLRFLRTLPGALQASTVISAVMLWYFLGHTLNWLSRNRSSPPGFRDQFKRVWSFLRFRPLKSPDPFDGRLKSLLEEVAPRFTPGRTPEWREFYPLAKNYLMNSGRASLLATYQNKYTLHRSIAAAGAGLFWLTLASMAAARTTFILGGTVYPNWLLLWVLLAGSVVVVSMFSATFVFYWRLWGDTIVTETHCAIFPPAAVEEPNHDAR